MIFIEEMIMGVNTCEVKPSEVPPPEVQTPKWTAKGRSEDKSFLYEIVSNKRNGIDVDKWDYFARDCHHLGISKSFDHQRLLKFTRVCEVEKKVNKDTVKRKLICFRHKEKDNVYDMFCTRYNLHRQAYQHKTVNIIEIMIKDALVEADDHFHFSESINNMTEYIKLTDHVLEKILYPDFDVKTLDEKIQSKLENAQTILEKIDKRCLPKFVKEARLPEYIKQKTLKKRLDGAIKKWNEKNTEQLKPDEFVVDVVRMDYGMKGKDLTENVYFYKKREPEKAFLIEKDQMTSILPEKFYEVLVRVYYKGKMFEKAQECVGQWCDDNFGQPKIVFYEERNCKGIKYKCKDWFPEIQKHLKKCHSIHVKKGNWKVFETPDSKDPLIALKEGDKANFPESIHSCHIKHNSSEIHLYEFQNFEGLPHVITEDCPSLWSQCHITEVYSCKVIKGKWILYQEENRDGTDYHLTQREYESYISWGANNATVKSLRKEKC